MKSKFRPRARRNESRLKCIETQPGYISSPEAFFYVLKGGERGRGTGEGSGGGERREGSGERGAEGGERGAGGGERGAGRGECLNGKHCVMITERSLQGKDGTKHRKG